MQSTSQSLFDEQGRNVWGNIDHIGFTLGAEKAFAWNTFRMSGVTSWNMNLMASFQLAMAFPDLGEGLQGVRSGAGESAIGRARRLLNRARMKSTLRESESISLRISVLENLYESRHNVLMKQRRAMRDLKEDQEEHGAVSVDLEVIRCGEMIVVTGSLPGPDSKNSHKGRAMRTGDRSNDLEYRKWHHNTVIRPMVLTSAEVVDIYDMAVSFFAKSLNKPDLEVLRMPKGKLLADFILQSIRLVSCGRISYQKKELESLNLSPLLSTARLSIPFIEYRRRERNE
jgi:hypothetical protein